MSVASHETVAEELTRYIRTQLLDDDQPADLDSTTPLLARGILNSIGTARVVTHIREEFGVRVPPAKIVGRHFQNIDSMADLVCSLADTRDHTTVNEIDIGGGRRIACVAEVEAQIVWKQIHTNSLYAEGVAGLGPGDLIIDVGAHIGLSAILFTDLAPGVRIVGFEPAPRSFACLEINRTRLVPTMTIARTAVGARPGAAELTYYPGHTTMSTLFVDDADDVRNVESALNHGNVPAEVRAEFWPTFRANPERVTVPVTTLGQELAQRRLGEVALLKIDVERAELDVLSGVADSQWPAIRRVVVEVHDIDGQLDRVTSLLSWHGYTVRVDTEEEFAEGSVRMVLGTKE
jgi:31-O-methyltransferase